MKGVHVFLPVALAILAASVSAQSCGQPCDLHGGCPSTTSCQTGMCVCQDDQQCNDGTCEAISLPGCSETCLSDGQCGSGTSCINGVCQCQDDKTCFPGHDSCMKVVTVEEPSACGGMCNRWYEDDVMFIYSCASGLDCPQSTCACRDEKKCSNGVCT